jgi:hypothetical protein
MSQVKKQWDAVEQQSWDLNSLLSDPKEHSLSLIPSCLSLEAGL